MQEYDDAPGQLRGATPQISRPSLTRVFENNTVHT